MTTPTTSVREHEQTTTSAQARAMLAECLLVDILGMDWATAHREASSIAGAITPRMEERIRARLGDPGTCPHGNPIPGSSNVPDQSTALPLWEASSIVEVVRVNSAIEADEMSMRLLEGVGLIPGRWAEILDRTDLGVYVMGSRAHAIILPELAEQILVRPVDLTCD